MSSPLLSVLTPVWETPAYALREAIESVLQQDADLELILVDDASQAPHVREILAEAEQDPRVLVVTRTSNGGIVAASNDAIDASRGEFLVLLDHDDTLAPQALRTVSQHLLAYDDVDYLYSDEDKIDEHGVRREPFRKPDWSPERLRGQMYTSHLSVLRTSLVREVGGFRAGYDGSQDHDLVLRVTERARRVVHVPKVLYHWRAIEGSTALDHGAKPKAWDAGRRAVQSHLDRLGIPAQVELGPVAGTLRIDRRLDPAELVSIVIPTRCSSALVWGERRVLVTELVRSIVTTATHPTYEIVVVWDTGAPSDVLRELERLGRGRVRLVEFDGPFNFSSKCNVGAIAARGEHLLFMNDDMQVDTPQFIERLVAPLAEPGVGATGARLLFADGRLQHAGHAYAGGHFFHPGVLEPADAPGPFCAYQVNREASGLTAACVAVTRTTFRDVGGFSETLPNNFNDVDLSCKIAARQLRLIWIANATLYHFESLTRVAKVETWEYEALLRRWGKPKRDRYLPTARLA